MNPERTITITHKNADGKLEPTEVRMLYCAASETGFQDITGKNISVFMPKIEFENGEAVMKEPPAAEDIDYIKLALACITAAYMRNNEQPPITSEDILYNASSDEVIEMVKAVAQMQQEWMFVPPTIERETSDNAKTSGKSKNAETPTKRSRRS